MGLPVLILGQSGSGKSTSLRNFEAEQVGVFSVAGKPLPFRGVLNSVTIRNANYNTIRNGIKKGTRLSYVIDDSQYLMAFAMFDRAKEVGYGKFTDIAVDFRNLVDFVIRETPDDCIVYFLHHTEMTDDGHVKAKTAGKMLDNQLTLEGLFTVVLLCETDGNTHHFVTQSNGYTTAKSPVDMFAEKEIDNDLQMVDETIREYWGMKPNAKTAERN